MLKQFFSSKLLLTIFSAFLFVVLFYEKSWGLNLFVFQIFWLASILFGRIKNLNETQKVILVGTGISILFTFLHHTFLGFYISFGSLFLSSISFSFDKLRSIHLIFLNLIPSWVYSPVLFIKELSGIGTNLGIPTYALKRTVIYLIPMVIIFTFFSLYASSNRTFGAMSASVFGGLETFFSNLWSYIQIPIIWFFIWGTLFSIPFFFTKGLDQLINIDETQGNNLKRVRKAHYSIKKMGLKLEMQMGVFMLIILNALLILLLLFELKDVWFGFSWNGQYLKEFVHQGMYLLTLSIIISIFLALYLFRGNLNFYSKNTLLKKLTLIWISLNGILVFSVAIRNLWYINYFSLAYGRIFLMFFLVAGLVGLITVFFKVKYKNNNTFLCRVNSLGVYALLIISTMFNWDVIITKYNFSNVEKGFLHLNYLSTLNNASLPYMVDDLGFLNEFDKKQEEKINESSISYRAKYLTPIDFKQKLNQRKIEFANAWKSKHWLSWNYAEWKANRLLI